MTLDSKTKEELVAELLDAQRRADRAERRAVQAERSAQIAESMSLQSKRALLRTYAELRETVEALSQAKAAAEQASDTKDRFLATISHELRTPMNGVLGSLELLLASRLDPEQHGLATLMHRSANSLLRIVNDLLDISKIEAGKLELESERFDLQHCLLEVTELEANSARAKGLELRMELGEDLPHWVVGDAGRLRQVLLNLLDNAIKFTTTGRVTLRACKGPRPGHCQFEVEDSGIGMAPETIGRIFEAFTQADDGTTRRYGGTGLGLAICEQLIQRMGGAIWVDSQPGRGSVFRFHCRLDPETAASEKPVATGCSDLARFALRALVVDDNAVNLLLARRMLQRLGCEVTSAYDGQKAVECCARDSFDVIFMDCSMPVMDGYRATAAIRSSGTASAAAKVIALTAYAREDDQQRCLAAGMDAYLAKPVRLRSVLETLIQLGFEPQA